VPCRQYRQRTSAPDFQVASEEDVADMLKSILDNTEFRKKLGSSEGKVKDEVAYYRKNISNIKNFCVNIDG
jgi:hypothetical protein